MYLMFDSKPMIASSAHIQVLLDENKKAYVADIGLGKMLAGKDAIASAATFYWASPEQLQVAADPLLA